MDNLTHGLVGALLGQAGLKRKTGLAMPALIIGANLPDVDAACFFWLDGAEHLAFRRGITHGPPALLLLPLLLACLLYGWDRWQVSRGKRPKGRLPVRFGWLYALALIGCLTHPALDWMNVYGIRLLEPFSSQWFYGDVLFIIDIWLWLGMGFATCLSLRREKHGGDWMRPARIAIAGVLAYIGVNAGITYAAETGAAVGEGQALIIASPPPIAFWRRDIITGGEGSYSVDGKPVGDADLRNCDLAAAGIGNPQLSAFLFWSRAPLVERTEDRIFIRDARYYDPLSREQFTVELDGLQCAEPAG